MLHPTGAAPLFKHLSKGAAGQVGQPHNTTWPRIKELSCLAEPIQPVNRSLPLSG